MASPRNPPTPGGHTTSPRTRVRTRSPISGEMSLPNCCSVVRKRFSLESWRAPQAGGSWWVEREAVEEVAGPLLNPLGVDGAPLMAVGEWLLPFITARREGDERSERAAVSWRHGDEAGMRNWSILLGTTGLAAPTRLWDAAASLRPHPGPVPGAVRGCGEGWDAVRASAQRGPDPAPRCSSHPRAGAPSCASGSRSAPPGRSHKLFSAEPSLDCSTPAPLAPLPRQGGRELPAVPRTRGPGEGTSGDANRRSGGSLVLHQPPAHTTRAQGPFRDRRGRWRVSPRSPPHAAPRHPGMHRASPRGTRLLGWH